jgi:spermidine synthase
MTPWELLGKALVPGQAGELRLYRRGEEFSIRADGQELMNSRIHGSEEALAQLACDRLSGRPMPRVLIGGLGMGFTLATALQVLHKTARVDVAELVPAVVEWNRGPLGGLAGRPLADKRVVIHVADVARLLRTEKQAFDGVLLDVDNGPEALTRKSNNWLYSPAGLRTTHDALRPRGVLAVWSAGPHPVFERRLHQAGFAVEKSLVRARDGTRGGHHIIWLAIRSA